MPLILLVVGIVVVIGALLLVKKLKSNKPISEDMGQEEDTDVAELTITESPYTSLTPTADGHWLDLNVKNLKSGTKSLDYELIYTVGDGRTQGVPGTIDLNGQSSLERKLLLGSESAGKFRYDAGVQKGTLTLKYRDSNGKLVGKNTTDFALLTNTTNLNSVDNSFSYTLTKSNIGTYFVVMKTFGLPSNFNGTVTNGPYGIFASDTKKYPGTVKLSGNTSFFDGSSWVSLSGSESSNIGVFVTSQ